MNLWKETGENIFEDTEEDWAKIDEKFDLISNEVLLQSYAQQRGKSEGIQWFRSPLSGREVSARTSPRMFAKYKQKLANKVAARAAANKFDAKEATQLAEINK